MNNSVNMAMNILFYSNKCQDCRTFIGMLKNENLINYFKSICVDNNMANIPKTIQRVPAIITADTKQLYMGGDVFKWLQSIKYMRQQQIVEQQKLMEQNRKIIQYNIYKNMNVQNQTNAPKSFLTSEMSGVSDTFAYTDIDLAQPKSFQEYGRDDSNIIVTPPVESRGLSREQQKNMTGDIENRRKEQDKIFNETMKQGQIQAVMRMEHEINTRQNNY